MKFEFGNEFAKLSLLQEQEEYDPKAVDRHSFECDKITTFMPINWNEGKELDLRREFQDIQVLPFRCLVYCEREKTNMSLYSLNPIAS